MKFTIDPKFLTDQIVTTKTKIIPSDTLSWPSDVLSYLESTDYVVTTTQNIDHPQFTELRETLGQQGYIEIQRSWWNGDRVVRPFELNQHQFEVGETFPCAAALGVCFKLDSF